MNLLTEDEKWRQCVVDDFKDHQKRIRRLEIWTMLATSLFTTLTITLFILIMRK